MATGAADGIALGRAYPNAIVAGITSWGAGIRP
jgi:hypothetical protein